MAAEDPRLWGPFARTCTVPAPCLGVAPSAPPASGATARPLLLHAGVSLCHHVTLQRPNHWFHCLLKRPDLAIALSFQDILQLVGFLSKFEPERLSACKSMPLCKYHSVYLHPPVFTQVNLWNPTSTQIRINLIQPKAIDNLYGYISCLHTAADKSIGMGADIG